MKIYTISRPSFDAEEFLSALQKEKLPGFFSGP